MATMKAVVLSRTGDPSVLEARAVPRPEPLPHQVLVRNRAAGVNYLDLGIRRGVMPPPMTPPLPHVLGVEGAGVVEAVGAKVSRLRPGQRVAWFGEIGAGGYAEYSAVDARFVTPLPDSVSDREGAAALATYGTALTLLERMAPAAPGDAVLVHAAAGGVGTALVQLASAAGLRVVGTAKPENFDYVRAQGASAVVDAYAPDLGPRLRAATEGAPLRASYNPVGGPTLLLDAELLAPFGRSVLYGLLAGPPSGQLAEALLPRFGQSIALGIFDIYTLFRSAPDEVTPLLERVIARLGGRVKPQIDRAFAGPEAASAHARYEQGGVKGKLVIDW